MDFINNIGISCPETANTKLRLLVRVVGLFESTTFKKIAKNSNIPYGSFCLWLNENHTFSIKRALHLLSHITDTYTEDLPLLAEVAEKLYNLREHKK